MQRKQDGEIEDLKLINITGFQSTCLASVCLITDAKKHTIKKGPNNV